MNKSVWKLILKVIMAVVTTIAGAVGVTSCMG